MYSIINKILYKCRVGKLLSAQINPNPLFFFFIIFLVKFDMVDIHNFAASLIGLGIVFLIASGYNYFFYCSPVVGSGIMGLSWVAGLLGILWANQTWKMYIFLFLLVYSLVTFDKNFENVYEIAISVFILVKTYQGMIFQSSKDNKYFFSGFFAVAAISFFEFFVRNSPGHQQMKIQNKLIILPFVIGLGYSIITSRSEGLASVENGEDTNLFKNPGILNHHIEQVIQKVKNISGLLSYLNQHLNFCNFPACYCKKYQQLTQKLLQQNPQQVKFLQKQIIDSIYQQFVVRQNSCQQTDKINSLHNYLFFLIDSEQYHKIVHIMFEMEEENNNYFELLSRLKVRQRISQKFQKLDYFDDRSSKYEHIYTYDYNMGYINKEIREILVEKINFWREVCQENPKVKFMEQSGEQLVDRIQNLHHFYMIKMRPSEEALSNFSCSIIYATYLLTTSNYSDFANSLLKRNQACIEEYKNQGAINPSPCFGLKLFLNKDVQRKRQNNYELMISNISGSLACLLMSEKKNLINEKITKIIPESFQQIHQQSFNKFFNYSNLKMQTSPFFKQTLQLPFKVDDEQIYFLKMTSRLCLDKIGGQLNIQTILQRPPSDSVNFIISLEAKILYSDNNHHQNLFYNNSQILQKIQSIKDQWINNGIIRSCTTKIIIQQSIYTFFIEPLFLKKFKKAYKQPLIRIKVQNQVFKTENNEIDQLQVNNKVKQVQKLEVRNENDSEASATSSRDSLENILLTLKDSNSIKMEKSLAITLFVLFTAALTFYLIIYLTITDWDNQEFETSPAVQANSYTLLRSYFNRAISWKLDSIQYVYFMETQSTQALDLLARLYPAQGYAFTQFFSYYFFFAFTRILSNQYILGLQTVITDLVEDYTQKIHTVSNPFTVDGQNILQIPQPSQQLTLQSTILNFIVDIYTWIQGETYQSTLLSFKYFNTMYFQLGEIIENSVSTMKEQLKRLENANIILISLTSLALLFFVIPLWKIAKNNKIRKEKVYNVLVSLDSKLVTDEISKLKKIEEEVFIYRYNLQAPKQSKQKIQTGKSSNSIVRQIQNHRRQSDLSVLMLGFKKVAADELIQVYKNEDKIKVRRRAGDPDLTNSTCDQKKILVSDWLILIFIICFIALNATLFLFKIQKMRHTDAYLDQTKQITNKIEKRSIILANVKRYFDEYQVNNKMTFMGKDLEKWLLQEIQNIPMARQPQDAQVKTCTENLLLCQQRYSNILLQDLLVKVIIDSFQIKKEVLVYDQALLIGNPQNLQPVPVSLFDKFSYQLYFAQQIDDKLMSDLLVNTDDSYSEFTDSQLTYINNIKRTLVYFCILMVIFIIFCVFYIQWMKKKYVKLVTMLSFLNKEMMFGNKRVQSFVSKLSKSFK